MTVNNKTMNSVLTVKRVRAKQTVKPKAESNSDVKPARNKRPFVSTSSTIFADMNAKVEAAKTAIKHIQTEMDDLTATLERDIHALQAIYDAEIAGRKTYIEDQEKVVAMGNSAMDIFTTMENAPSQVAMAA